MRIFKHTIHVNLNTRVVICVGGAGACFAAYYFGHIELGLKGFEIAAAPILERFLFHTEA